MNHKLSPFEARVSTEAEIGGPRIEIRTVPEIRSFNLEKMSEARPEQIPDGLLYMYIGRTPQFLQSEGEGGSSWITYQRWGKTDTRKPPLPEGIEPSAEYINWQGKRYKRRKGRGEESLWEKVDIPDNQ